jgi:uncharacterized protein YacL
MVTSGGTKQYVIGASILSTILGIALSYFYAHIADSKAQDFYDFCSIERVKYLQSSFTSYTFLYF